jgi:tripartite-type tricarboxylate transporter receptor subunit TctC
MRRRTWIKPLALSAAAMLVLAACGAEESADETTAETTAPAEATESAEDFYAENDTIRVAGGHDAGSGFDFYMRAVAGGIERVSELGTTVDNIPGGGGLIGDNTVFSAEPDGLTIGLLNYPGHVFAQLTDTEQVEYDFAEWEWLGRVAAGPPVIIVAADSEFQTAEDLIAADRVVKFGIEGAGSDAFYGAALAAKTFGFEGENVTGYEGTSDIITGILRGEVDATFLSFGSARSTIEAGEMRALMLFGSEQPEGAEDIPLATEFAPTPEDEATLVAFGNIYALERVFVAPPGTPEDRVEFLRSLLMEVFAEEQFLAEIEEAGRPTDPMSGADVDAASDAVAGEADTLRELLEGL